MIRGIYSFKVVIRPTKEPIPWMIHLLWPATNRESAQNVRKLSFRSARPTFLLEAFFLEFQ